MIYNLSNPYDKEKFKEKCRELYEQEAHVELKKKVTNRTLAQNSYLHIILGYFASEFGYTIDEVKFDIFKRVCNKDLFERTRKNKRGKTITYIRSSTELDKREMSLAIDRFRNYSSAKCGLYLPEANEGQALFFAQQQMEQYKEFM
jgi:hypothetical protein